MPKGMTENMRSMTRIPHVVRATLLVGLALFAAPQRAVEAQTARDVLTNFPDSQAVVYVNTQRILGEAAPRVMTQKKLDEALDKMKREAMGFDVRSVHHVAAGLRFKGEPKPGTLPEFVVLIKGDFNADSLLSLARMAMADNLTEETYGSRTINVFKMSPPKKGTVASGSEQPPQQPEATTEPKSAPPAPPISEIAVVVLDANTLLAGIPDYVKAAIDAETDATARLKPGLLDLAARNPQDLVTMVGDVPDSLAGFIPGGQSNTEMTKIISSIKQLQASVSMTPSDFGIQAIIRTDTPDSARAISGMVAIGLRAAEAGIQKDIERTPKTKVKDHAGLQAALSVVRTMTNTTDDNEVTISTAIPQQTVASFVQHQMTKSQTQKAKPATKRKSRRRSSARKA